MCLCKYKWAIFTYSRRQTESRISVKLFVPYKYVSKNIEQGEAKDVGEFITPSNITVGRTSLKIGMNVQTKT